MAKKSKTQDLLEAIMVQYKIKDVQEAWKKYHQLYEDQEAEPSKINALINANTQAA
jgi:hypothetical protein